MCTTWDKAGRKVTTKKGRETQASIKRRIADATGFQTSKIELMEANGCTDLTCEVWFQVNGRGFWTNFEELKFDDRYNDRS